MPVAITIVQAQDVKYMKSAFLEYTIHVKSSENTPARVVRTRYSDLKTLYEQLEPKFGAIVLGKFPQKHLRFATPDAEFLNARKALLDKFLNNIAMNEILLNESCVVNLFHPYNEDLSNIPFEIFPVFLSLIDDSYKEIETLLTPSRRALKNAVHFLQGITSLSGKSDLKNQQNAVEMSNTTIRTLQKEYNSLKTANVFPEHKDITTKSMGLIQQVITWLQELSRKLGEGVYKEDFEEKALPSSSSSKAVRPKNSQSSSRKDIYTRVSDLCVRLLTDPMTDELKKQTDDLRDEIKQIIHSELDSNKPSQGVIEKYSKLDSEIVSALKNSKAEIKQISSVDSLEAVFFDLLTKNETLGKMKEKLDLSLETNGFDFNASVELRKEAKSFREELESFSIKLQRNIFDSARGNVINKEFQIERLLEVLENIATMQRSLSKTFHLSLKKSHREWLLKMVSTQLQNQTSELTRDFYIFNS